MSKTEAMYFPPPRVEYSAADTSRIVVLDARGQPAGFIDFTTEFKYLGSIVHYSLSSEADVDKRIKSATAAFGALKICSQIGTLISNSKVGSMSLYASAFSCTVARSGLCGRTCSVVCAAFTTAACSQCAGSIFPTQYGIKSQQAASSLVSVLSR